MREQYITAGYAIINGDGYWVGIWKSEEVARQVLARGLPSNQERLVILYMQVPQSVKHNQQT